MASQLKQFDIEKLTGKVYTPGDVASLMLDEVGFGVNDESWGLLVDPACGDGAFLVAAANRILGSNLDRRSKKVALSELHGWDLDEEAIEKCREKLETLAVNSGITNVAWNLEVRDALDLDHVEAQSNRFKFVVANPPYVRIQHLDVETRKFLAANYSYCSVGSTDIYLAFIELGERLISDTGKACFITPNSFLNSDAGRPLRQAWAKSRKLSKLINFGHHQIFPNASTYNAIFTFSNIDHEFLSFENWSYPLKSIEVKLVSFTELELRPIWNLNVELVDEASLRLRDICSIHVGLQTLADKVFFVTPFEDDGYLVSIKSRINGETYKIEKSALRVAIKASKLASTPVDVLNRERLVWPYGDLKSAGSKALDETTFKMSFPHAFAYLLAHKGILDARDNGAVNPAGWYAFARQQGIRSQFQGKIVFPPMVENPTFVLMTQKDVAIYSGYFILSKYPLSEVLDVLNSPELSEWVNATGRDFRGGWKSMSKKLLEDFPIPERYLRRFESDRLF